MAIGLHSVPDENDKKMAKVYKEDEISIRVDRCLYDSLIKFGKSLGFFLGVGSIFEYCIW